MLDHLTRRDFVERLGAVGATWMLGARSLLESHQGDPHTHGPPRQLRFFTRTEARDVEAIAERIIPSDDGPGAKEAGVLYFIDDGLATYAKDMRQPVRTGIAELAGKVASRYPGTTRFAALTAAQRDALLRDEEKTPFFGIMRYASIAGMLALPSYGGNRNYVGWKAIGLDMAAEYSPPFGYYDRPEVRRQLLGLGEE